MVSRDQAKRKAKGLCHELDQKLHKLGNIHQQVDFLRSKQDLKSHILSIDAEIRMQISKLLEIDQLQGGNRKTINLHKEERCRKEMKTTLDSKVRQLEALLNSWEEKESAAFETSLLSSDVRLLLSTLAVTENGDEKSQSYTSATTRRLPQRGKLRYPSKVPTPTFPPSRSNLDTVSAHSKKSPTEADQRKENQKREREEDSHVATSAARKPKKRAKKSRREDRAILAPFARALSDPGSPSPSDNTAN